MKTLRVITQYQIHRIHLAIRDVVAVPKCAPLRFLGVNLGQRECPIPHSPVWKTLSRVFRSTGEQEKCATGEQYAHEEKIHTLGQPQVLAVPFTWDLCAFT